MTCNTLVRQTLIAALAALTTMASAASNAATVPDSHTPYVLTNAFLKDSKALGVADGRVVMAANDPANPLATSEWTFSPVPGRPGYYRITNVSLGTAKSLDSSPTAPVIGNSGNYSGQLWKLVPAGNGYFRLTNMYQPRMSLQISGRPTYAPRLGRTANFSGQLWKLTPQTRIGLAPGTLRQMTSTLNVSKPGGAASRTNAAASNAVKALDPHKRYILTNAFLKDAKALGVANDHVVMAANNPADTHAVPQIDWIFSPVSGHPGYYRITNASLGTAKSLDSSPTEPVIGNSGNRLGQLWKLVPAGNGYFRLTNMYQPRKSLDNWGSAPYAPRLADTANYSGQLWKLTVDTRPLPNPNSTQPVTSTTLHLTQGTITVSGSALLPNTNFKNQPLDVNHDQPTLDVNGGHAVTVGTAQPLTVGGCVAPSAALKSVCAGRNASAAAAAAGGQSELPPPGLGAFLVSGALSQVLHNNDLKQGSGTSSVKGTLPMLEQLYANPAALQIALQGEKVPPAKWADEYQDMCEHPLENVHVKALMFSALLNAIGTKPEKRNPYQRRFVDAFASYMQQAKLFAAEHAQHEYDLWKYGYTQDHPTSSLAGVFTLHIPPEVLKSKVKQIMVGSWGLGAAAAAVAGSIAAISAYATVQTAVVASATASAAAFGTGIGVDVVAYAATESTAMAGLLGGGAIGELSAAQLAGVFAGPAAIVAAGIAMSGLAIYEVADAEKFEQDLRQAVEDAKKPVDLASMIQSKDDMAQVVLFWAKAVGLPKGQAGAVVFRSGGDRRTACARTPVRLIATPSGLSGQLVNGPGVTVGGRRLGADQILQQNGLGPNTNPITHVGELAWRAAVIARMANYDIAHFAYVQKTGKPYRNIAWEAPVNGKMPADAVVGGMVGGKPVYICRGNAGVAGWVPGMVWQGKCQNSRDGREMAQTSFEVLTAGPTSTQWMPADISEAQWVQLRTSLKFPANTGINQFPRVATDVSPQGDWMYVCQAPIPGGSLPGRLAADGCHVGWGGHEVIVAKPASIAGLFTGYTVLVQKVAWLYGYGPRQSHRPKQAMPSGIPLSGRTPSSGGIVTNNPLYHP